MRQQFGLPDSNANLRLWYLQNPIATATGGASTAVFCPFSETEHLSGNQVPWLFLHGAQYRTPQEAISDFVQPFLNSVLKTEDTRTDINPIVIFASWNSALLSQTQLQVLGDYSWLRKLWFYTARIPWWSVYLNDAEVRATEAAKDLLPSIERMIHRIGTGPNVVTHSLGAKVWADTLMQMQPTLSATFNPGIWWILQPALARDAFAKGGEYVHVRKLYERGRSIIYYSRFDIVLGTIFYIAKGKAALGQRGCIARSLPQRDLSFCTGGAHGVNYFRKRLGCFFKRSSDILRKEAVTLGFLNYGQVK